MYACIPIPVPVIPVNVDVYRLYSIVQYTYNTNMSAEGVPTARGKDTPIFGVKIPHKSPSMGPDFFIVQLF
jgi:hypothetical protein